MLSDTDRLLGTVEQVLRAGQVMQRRRHSPEEIEFPALVQECMELARARHHLDSQRLRFETNGNAPTLLVHGDVEELRTAILNLLDNAVKYSQGEVDVTAEIETEEKNVVLRVRDKGVGIPQADLKRVFKRFYRVANGRGTSAKGTGLGLFIVRTIARKHGGKVFAESAGMGKGTTVTMQLPRSAG
jgi:signal transduction histidine kinase